MESKPSEPGEETHQQEEENRDDMGLLSAVPDPAILVTSLGHGANSGTGVLEGIGDTVSTIVEGIGDLLSSL